MTRRGQMRSEQSMPSSFPVGKLPNAMLAEILARHAPQDPRVVVGPGIGLDTAVLDMGDRYLVAKTDPITFATDLIGWYAVHVNANDLACSGARPMWFLADLLLPPERDHQALAQAILQQIDEACRSLGASLVGGHTEITFGLDRPIVVGCLLGEVEKEALITTRGARPGDAVLLVGGVPIEGTALIAREKAADLADRFEPEFLTRCRELLFAPGISVVEYAGRARQLAEVHAMHDPTEGGLAAGLWELAQASSCVLAVQRERIPILPEGQQLCEALGLDPLATIASGALLLCAAPEGAERLCQAFEREGTRCAVIGQVAAGAPAVTLRTAGREAPLALPERDEIAHLFG
jgi:hydrogenase maturation factor